MYRNIFLLSLTLFFVVIYVTLLGSKGIWERRELEIRLEALQEEVDKLENESNFLEVKRKTLTEDKNALAKEASKYYILSDEAKIIHFKESLFKETNDNLFASSLPSGEMKKKYKSDSNSSHNFLRLIYIIAVGAILITIFYKLSTRIEYEPKRNFK